MKNDFYKVTMAEGDTPARLDLFGVIGGGLFEQGFDEAAFANAMDGIGDEQPLDIYINSPGGSVFAAIAIYNLIARHEGPVTIHVAGLAASAATIITSVPNGRVIMPAGSMMLIHPVRADVGSSTTEELKEAAVNLEKIRESVLSIYEKKTGLERERLLAMMKKESFLTSAEAVTLGFADELDNDSKVENVLTDGVLMINGLKVSASLFDAAPKGFIPSEKEAKKMDVEMLKKEQPELVEQIQAAAYAKGAEDERARILAIEEIAVAGHEELVESAKRDGAMNAEKLAVAILKADKARGISMLKARAEDASELDEIVPTGNMGFDEKAEKQKKEEAEMQAIIEAGRRGFNNRGGK